MMLSAGDYIIVGIFFAIIICLPLSQIIIFFYGCYLKVKGSLDYEDDIDNMLVGPIYFFGFPIILVMVGWISQLLLMIFLPIWGVGFMGWVMYLCCSVESAIKIRRLYGKRKVKL